MKLQSANGRLETNQQVGTGFVCRQMVLLSASITCTHIFNTASVAFPFKFSISLLLSLPVGLAPPSRYFYFYQLHSLLRA